MFLQRQCPKPSGTPEGHGFAAHAPSSPRRGRGRGYVTGEIDLASMRPDWSVPPGDAIRAEEEGLIVELADEAFIDETDLGCS
jgi:hypothetical protein